MSEKEVRNAEAVGASDMEAEHELLVNLLHELQAALGAGRDDSVAELLARFEDATSMHFMEEQTLMRLHAYPGYAAHEQEHDELIAELRELARRIAAGEMGGVAQAAQGLEDWLMTHMNTTDEALEKYMRQAGVRPTQAS